MNLNELIDFLLDNAGSVIQYRLRKEILNNTNKVEEEILLEKIYQLPQYKLLLKYTKANGHIGTDMHSWDNWRGEILRQTPLQDGETAARLLSYYSVPKTHLLVRNLVTAMRDEDILREEFSCISPEKVRYENRLRGISSGYCLMLLIYTIQAMLGYGDDEYVKPF